jgi:hypothetical protein
MASRKQQKEQARLERLAREEQRKAAARRKRRLSIVGGALSVAVVAAVVVVVIVSGGGGGSSASAQLSKQGSTPKLKLASTKQLGQLKSPGSLGPVGPEGIPIPQAPTLASTAKMASGSSVDGVGCLGQEQTLMHIHAHLTVFVNGAARQIPYAIGITHPGVQNTAQGAFVGAGSVNSCFYYLHTHAADGIIHIESPQNTTYTLADFFDIWGQPLSPRQVGPATGTVTAFYNGKLYQGNPRDIPLNKHAQIQLDVGKPLVAPANITSWSGL